MGYVASKASLALEKDNVETRMLYWFFVLHMFVHNFVSRISSFKQQPNNTNIAKKKLKIIWLWLNCSILKYLLNANLRNHLAKLSFNLELNFNGSWVCIISIWSSHPATNPPVRTTRFWPVLGIAEFQFKAQPNQNYPSPSLPYLCFRANFVVNKWNWWNWIKFNEIRW